MRRPPAQPAGPGRDLGRRCGSADVCPGLPPGRQTPSRLRRNPRGEAWRKSGSPRAISARRLPWGQGSTAREVDGASGSADAAPAPGNPGHHSGTCYPRAGSGRTWPHRVRGSGIWAPLEHPAAARRPARSSWQRSKGGTVAPAHLRSRHRPGGAGAAGGSPAEPSDKAPWILLSGPARITQRISGPGAWLSHDERRVRPTGRARTSEPLEASKSAWATEPTSWRPRGHDGLLVDGLESAGVTEPQPCRSVGRTRAADRPLLGVLLADGPGVETNCRGVRPAAKSPS